jgi:hypothetical protein
MKRLLAFVSILSILCLFWQPHLAFASGISSDTSAINFTASGTSDTLSYPMGSGSNGLLIVSALCNNGDHIGTTGATFNGVTMSFDRKENSRQTLWDYIFYEYNPPSGTHNIVVSTDGTSCEIDVGAASYFGVSQSGFPDATQSQGGVAASSLTMTVTTVANNDWAFMVCGMNNGPTTAGTNTTKLQDDLPSGDMAFYDNSGHGNITPAGSFSMTCSAAGSNLTGGIMDAFAPVGVAAPHYIAPWLDFLL